LPQNISATSSIGIIGTIYESAGRFGKQAGAIMADLEVHLMRPEDIDGAIDTIQQAFADDPYNNWIYPSKEQVFTSSPFLLPISFQIHLIQTYSSPPSATAFPSPSAATGA
jgi:hypothetical protein